MNKLAQALDNLESRWRDLELAIVPALQPGLTEQEVRDAWAERGLTPPEELIRWFTWHNGQDPDCNDKGLADAWFLTLDESLEVYALRSGPPDDFKYWIPLTSDGHGGNLCVSARQAESGLAKITYLDKVPEPRDEPYTLEQVVRVWINRIDTGKWYRGSHGIEATSEFFSLLPLSEE